jgi:hypothetical protein
MDLPGVAEAVTRTRDEVTAAHRHPANRRSWPTTAAEASVRAARASAGWTALPDDGPVDDPVLAGTLRRRRPWAVRDPDPTSPVGYIRIIGYSPSAGFVLTVIADPGGLVRCDRVEEARGRPPRIPRGQGGPLMTNTPEEARAARRARHKAILAEVAQEEAEAAEAEIGEKATLDMPFHLRIDKDLDAQRERATP